MAVTFTAERYAVAQGASSANLVSGSFTPAANAVLVAVMHVSDGLTSISGHDSGGSWVQIGSTFTASGRDLQIWACHVGGSPSAGTVTFTIPYNWNIAVTLLEFAGVDTSGTVAASFGTPVGAVGYDNRGAILNPAAFGDEGNATLACHLDSGGTAIQRDHSPWYTQIGAAGSNGAVGASWYDQEDIDRYQVGMESYLNAADAVVEIKAATPKTLTTRHQGNGGLSSTVIDPEQLADGARFIQFTTIEAGTLGSVWSICQVNDTSSDTYGMYLYDSSGNLLDSSDLEVVSGAGVVQWVEFVGMTYSLEASTTYYLGIAADNDFQSRVGRCSSGANYYAGYEVATGYTDPASPVDPATIVTDTGSQTFGMYIEYEPDTGGVSGSITFGLELGQSQTYPSTEIFPYHLIKQRRRAMQTIITR